MKNETTRREFATAVLAATTVCGAAVPALVGEAANQGVSQKNPQDTENQVPDTPETSAEAIERLAKGNARFVSGDLQHPHSANDWRKRLIDGQAPFACLLYTSPSPRDKRQSRMPSSA